MTKVKPKNNIQDKNYFDYIYNFRLFKSELLKINTFEDIEIFMSKVMSYIYSRQSLLSIFKNEINIYVLGKNIKQQYLYEYEKVKCILRKFAQTDNSDIIFNNNSIDFIYKKEKNGDVVKAKAVRGLFDIPQIYFYPSIGLPFSKLIKSKDLQFFKVSNSLSQLYHDFAPECYQINIPQNVEFFVFSVFSFYSPINYGYNVEFFKENTIAYFKTCINFVIDRFQNILKDEIVKRYFDDSSFILFNEYNSEIVTKYAKKQYVLTFTKDKKFKLDSKILNLKDIHENTLKKFLQITEDETFFRYNELIDSEKDVIKTHANRINDVARKLIGQKLVEFDKIGNYRLLKNIYFRDLNSSDNEE